MKKVILITLFLLFNVNIILSDDDIVDNVDIIDDIEVIDVPDVVEVVEEDVVVDDDLEDGDDIFEFGDEFEMEIEIVEEEDEVFESFPQLVEFIEAEYPQELQDEGIRGNVLLNIIVNETGTVDSVDVARSLHPVLDTNAMIAVRQFQFSPAKLRTGEYVAVMLQYEYRFHFEDVITEIEIEDTTQIIQEIANVVDDDFESDDGALVLDESLELTVYGREQSTEVAHHRLTIAEVKRVPGLGGEALRVVQAMPGVARPSFGGNEVIVRGLPSWATNNYIDGVSVPLLYHIGGNTSSYPSEAVDAVDFYPGGFGVRYGGATGGVIEMRSRKSNTDSITGYVDLSNLDGALFIEGPINDRVSFMASARRGFVGDLLSWYFENHDPSGIGVVAAPFYWDFLLRTDVVINDNNDLFVKIIGSRDSLGVFVPTMQSGSPEIESAVDEMSMKLLFYTLVAGLDSRISDRLKNSLRVSGTLADSRMSMFGFATMQEDTYMTHIRNELNYVANDNVTFNVGADVNIITLDLDVNFISGQNMVDRVSVTNNHYGNIGAYANVEWRPVERLLLVPGIRYDHFIELDEGVPAFRISGRYEYRDDHTIKAAFGTYSQSPEPYGFVIHETVGEPGLPPTKAEHYVLGYEWQISDLIHFDAQGYFNNMHDVARAYDNDIDYDSTLGFNQRRFFSDGRQRSYGVELMLRHNRGERFFGWISYTLSRSETWSKKEDEFVLSSRDEPHHLQLMGSWRLQNDWEVGTRLRYVSGHPSTPVVGTVEDVNYKNISPIYGEENSTRRDPFVQLDVRIDKKIQYNRWALTYYLDLQNLLWPLYRSPEFEYWNYNYTENQKISMIPMFAAGVRAEF